MDFFLGGGGTYPGLPLSDKTLLVSKPVLTHKYKYLNRHITSHHITPQVVLMG